MQFETQRKYLAEVADQINELIVGSRNNRFGFVRHINKVMQEAEKHRHYLLAEWKKAIRAGLTEYVEGKEKEGLLWYSAANNDDGRKQGCVYFDTDECPGVQFYMKSEPKLDPLGYLLHMISGSVGEAHPVLELLDYQFLLLAIIHDAQNWQAGRQRIYFEPTKKEGLASRVCQTVWHKLDGRQNRDVNQTIQTALRAENARIRQIKRFSEFMRAQINKPRDLRREIFHTQQLAKPANKKEEHEPLRKQKITKDEANVRARELLRDNPVLDWTVKKLANQIPCSQGLVTKLPAWRAYHDKRKELVRTPTIDVVHISKEIESVLGTGDKDGMLKQLIAEQEEDQREDERQPKLYFSRNKKPNRGRS